MKHFNSYIRYTLALAAFIMGGQAMAQNLNSAYFLDGFTVAHEINPARDYERQSYFSMPLLGNVNLGMRGNLSATDVLKPFNGGLVTYLHPSISVSDALSGFEQHNTSNMDMRLDIISFGFHKWGGFNTFNLSMRSNMAISAPYSLFEVTKNLQNKDYAIDDMRMNATSWVEAGFGHSRNVTEAWRVGGKFKVLLGGAYSNMQLNNARLNLVAPDKWVLTADATMDVALKGFEWGEKEIKEYKSGGTYEQINFNNMDVRTPGIGGWGLALDLGAEWDLGKQDLVRGMKLSASVLDIGFLSWSENHNAYNKGKEVIFTGFNNIRVHEGTGTEASEQSDYYADRFSDLMAMQEGETSGKTSMLGATLNIGLEYALPQYDKLSFGMLSTTRIQGVYTWNEERFSATISPLSWLEGSINLGVGTLGTSMGWVLNIHPKGFNMFLGMDHAFGKLSKQGLPLKGNSDITIGISFPLGKKI